MAIAERINQISPSPTLDITAKAKKMQSEGINVIGFGTGEPDFDTPINIKEAAKRAIDKGFTKYTPTSGIRELKEAICKKFKIDNGLEYKPEEIIVSCGAKHAIFNTILTLCEQGDEVILPSPYWVSYLEMIKIAQAKPVIVHTTKENNFKIIPKELEKAITTRTKLFILNSPSNPTGMVYTKDELEALSKIIVKAGIYCLSDEIYEKIIYDVPHISIASLGKEIKAQTIVINGVSKAYSMTGWRIGYAAGPREIIQAISNLQDHSTSNPTSIAQVASVEALTGSQEELKKMVSEFRKRRDYMVEKINSFPKISTLNPQGAFYCWVDISEILGRRYNSKQIRDSLELTDLLLSSVYVAVVPGNAFGDENYIRLSYATSFDNIVEGLKRIEGFIHKIG